MSEHHFGVGSGRIKTVVANRIDRIARQRGACFVSTTIPGDGPRYWFACKNQGFPFDRDTERAVWSALEADGLADNKGLSAKCFS